ncbi:hypothetical protein ETH_00022195, partial [Eimeria tenella]
FTFTDEDVEEILEERQQRGEVSVHRRGALLKHVAALKHQINSILESLSSSRTASSRRQELKETLALLLQQKETAEAELLRERVSNPPVSFLKAPAAAAKDFDKNKSNKLAAAHKPQPAAAPLHRAADHPAAAAGGSAAAFLAAALGSTQEQQQALVTPYLELRGRGAELAARMQQVSPSAAVSFAPLLIPDTSPVQLPLDCLCISLEEYKRQVAQLASMQLAG